MKKPDLQYNYYYPYYTQKITGQKKYSHSVYNVMYISEDHGILIQIDYTKKKLSKVIISMMKESIRLYEHRISSEYLSYVSFAKEVGLLYRVLSHAINTLSSEPAYVKKMIYSTLLKHNDSMELELSYNQISVEFKDIKYRIEEGKHIEDLSRYGDGPLKDLGSAFQSITEYKPIEEDRFKKEFDYIWESFVPYLSAPKTIRKTKYDPYKK